MSWWRGLAPLCVPIATGFTAWYPLCEHWGCLRVGRENSAEFERDLRVSTAIPSAHLQSSDGPELRSEGDGGAVAFQRGEFIPMAAGVLAGRRQL